MKVSVQSLIDRHSTTQIDHLTMESGICRKTERRTGSSPWNVVQHGEHLHNRRKESVMFVSWFWIDNGMTDANAIGNWSVIDALYPLSSSEKQWIEILSACVSDRARRSIIHYQILSWNDVLAISDSHPHFSVCNDRSTTRLPHLRQG